MFKVTSTRYQYWHQYLVLTLLALPKILWADQIEIPTNIKTVALLGTGYNSDKQSFLGPCIEGEVAYEGLPQSNLDFTTSVSQRELSTELGFELGGRYRYGLVSMSASSKFMRNTKSTGHSISSTYVGSYSFKNRLMRGGGLSTIGKKVQADPIRWGQTCGNYYAAQQVLGAKIFFSIRLDFKTASSKNAFSANFNISGPAFGVNAKLKAAMNSFSKDTRVTVSALQIGGRVDKLSQIFHGSTSSGQNAYEYVQCSLGKFDKCEGVLSRMIDYATNVETGFPSQINPNAEVGSNEGPAVIKTLARPYTDLGIYSPFSSELNTQIRMARRRIQGLFEEVYQQYVQAVALTKNGIVRLSPTQKSAMSETEKSLWDSLTRIAKASSVCYESPAECPYEWEALDPDTGGDMRVKLFSPEHFVVTPQTFAQFCDWGTSKHGEGEDQRLMHVLLKRARAHNPDAFKPMVEGASIDVCQVAQDVLGRTRELDLSGEKLTTLKALRSLAHLTKLNLSHNQLDKEALMDLQYLKGIEWLELSFNRIKDSTPLAELTELTYLGLASNDLKHIDPLATLPKIEKVDLRNNGPDIKCPFPEDRKAQCLIADYRTNNTFVSVNRNLRIPRWGHAALALKDGRVFITGGLGTNDRRIEVDASQGSEIYDPRSGRFQREGHMIRPRVFHTATRLKDGKVLLVGGFRAGVAMEIYDPQKRSYHLAGYDTTKRAHHQALKLKDGRVLVTGGATKEIDLVNPILATQSSFLYLPNGPGPRPIEAMKVPRMGHTMTLLNDGRVLIAGGFNFERSHGSAEIFDPVTGQFSKLPSRLHDGRGFHSAVKLKDGRVLLAGGFGENGKALASVEIFDPEKERFDSLGDLMSQPRGSFQAYALDNGSVLMVGGASEYINLVTNMETSDHCLKSGEIFDPRAELSTQVQDQMLYRRCEFSMTPVSDKSLLILGGRGTTSPFMADLFEFSFKSMTL